MLCFVSQYQCSHFLFLRGKMTAQLGNQTTLTHGGAGALKAIEKHKPFTGIILQAEEEVKADLRQADGLAQVMEQDAIRLETAARLYFDAFKKAIQDQDIEQATAYVKVFGWLQSSSLRAWQLVKGNRGREDTDRIIDAAIQSAKEATHGENQ
jgi:hypothetical protein